MDADYLCSTLQEWYEYAVMYLDNQYFQSKGIDEHKVQSLFDGQNSKKLIRECIGEWTGLYSRDYATKKIYSLISNITDFRSRHTVSAFLLGIIVKNKLSLNIQCQTEESSMLSIGSDTFDFLWPIVCLMHDAGYKFERSSKKYLEKYPTLEDFCNKLNIQYNLLEKSNKAELLINYYAFRADKSNEKPKIDHGITGGVLLYDALMTFSNFGGLYHLTKYNDESMSCERFNELAIAISEAVAVHNLWVANADTFKQYTQYHLEELIIDDSRLNRKFFEDNSLQFLLGFIDTIDPFKAFCNTEGGAEHISHQELLQEFHICFPHFTHNMETYVSTKNKLFTKYINTVKGMEDWLGVLVNPVDNQKLVISIPTRQEYINASKNVG